MNCQRANWKGESVVESDRSWLLPGVPEEEWIPEPGAMEGGR